MIALVIVMGEVEDLAPDGSVRGRATADTRIAEYEHFCRAQGLVMLDLVDR